MGDIVPPVGGLLHYQHPLSVLPPFPCFWRPNVHSALVFLPFKSLVKSFAEFLNILWLQHSLFHLFPQEEVLEFMLASTQRDLILRQGPGCQPGPWRRIPGCQPARPVVLVQTFFLCSMTHGDIFCFSGWQCSALLLSTALGNSSTSRYEQIPTGWLLVSFVTVPVCVAECLYALPSFFGKLVCNSLFTWCASVLHHSSVPEQLTLWG